LVTNDHGVFKSHGEHTMNLSNYFIQLKNKLIQFKII
jgi:hypothetical protein